MTSQDIWLLNPNTGTCSTFRSKRDASITRSIYEHVPILIDESEGDTGNPWGATFFAMFHMTNDSHYFKMKDYFDSEDYRIVANVFEGCGESYLPLYEGKFTQIFDHRFASFTNASKNEIAKGNPRGFSSKEHLDPNLLSIPRYWVKAELHNQIMNKNNPSFWLTFHDVANPNNERTFIATICPPVALGNTLPCLLFLNQEPAAVKALLLACTFNSFVFDYVARLKIGSRHFNFFIVKQLPVIEPNSFNGPCAWTCNQILRDWILPYGLELTYTAEDLQAFAKALGYIRFPFRWNDERRFKLRCELDACYFHLYGIDRDDVDYIMETFPIVKRKDEEKHGEYRTKRVILEIYDEMAKAMRTGTPYQTRLDPPPGPPKIELPEWKPGQPKPEDWPSHIHAPKGCET